MKIKKAKLFLMLLIATGSISIYGESSPFVKQCDTEVTAAVMCSKVVNNSKDKTIYFAVYGEDLNCHDNNAGCSGKTGFITDVRPGEATVDSDEIGLPADVSISVFNGRNELIWKASDVDLTRNFADAYEYKDGHIKYQIKYDPSQKRSAVEITVEEDKKDL